MAGLSFPQLAELAGAPGATGLTGSQTIARQNARDAGSEGDGDTQPRVTILPHHFRLLALGEPRSRQNPPALGTAPGSLQHPPTPAPASGSSAAGSGHPHACTRVHMCVRACRVTSGPLRSPVASPLPAAEFGDFSLFMGTAAKTALGSGSRGGGGRRAASPAAETPAAPLLLTGAELPPTTLRPPPPSSLGPSLALPIPKPRHRSHVPR